MITPLSSPHRLRDLRWLLPLLAIAVIAPARVHAQASASSLDNALVVGVNEYPGLNGATLHGCVGDAEAMAAALQRYGFHVTLLTDDRATKAAIMDVLAAFSKLPRGRFAFFFAGHGTRTPDGKSAMLLSDATEADESHDIRPDALYDAIIHVPATSRTVILDSCFSGGMMRSMSRSLTSHPHLLSRFYLRSGPAGTAAKGFESRVGVNGQDGSKDLFKVLSGVTSKPGPVCYFAAAHGNEQAGEDDFDGQRHGVFTHYLLQELDGASKPWGDVQMRVASRVSDWMDGTQHPILNPAFVDKALFEGLGEHSAPTPEPQHTVWDEYSADHADSSRVTVLMDPNRTEVTANMTHLHIVATALVPGYMVIVELGTSGRINLLYPHSLQAADALVVAGKVVNIPEGEYDFTPDTPGKERVKAILFEAEDKCAALLGKFDADLKIPSVSEAQKRDLVRVQRSSFYTSDINFEAVPAE